QSMDLLLTGRRIQAEEALALGLVTRIVSPESLLDEAWLLANRLADLPVAPVAALKQLLRQGMDLDLPQALELESRVTARLST
ncbi:MAG: hypothetical protein EGP13_02415, partial [SAR202 cluster bacterium]